MLSSDVMEAILKSTLLTFLSDYLNLFTGPLQSSYASLCLLLNRCSTYSSPSISNFYYYFTFLLSLNCLFAISRFCLRLLYFGHFIHFISFLAWTSSRFTKVVETAIIIYAP